MAGNYENFRPEDTNINWPEADFAKTASPITIMVRKPPARHLKKQGVVGRVSGRRPPCLPDVQAVGADDQGLS
jgi:hypothetical protein